MATSSAPASRRPYFRPTYFIFLALRAPLTSPPGSFLLGPPAASAGLVESERVDEYRRRGHRWPPPTSDFVPPTEGWARLHRRRFEQVRRIEDPHDRWNGWVCNVHTGLVAPNFTEYGWAVTRAPEGLLDALLASLHGAFDRPFEEEGPAGCIDSPEMPLLHPIGDLERRAMLELRPIAEAWINHEGRERRHRLIGNNAYGLRIYRNQSRLHMHTDKTETHIVSAILHVDHDAGSEPWPIVIEDYKGNLNEVVLERGDVLLYESSKCFHGRPRRFHGDWYTSLFVHFYPSHWPASYEHLDVHYRVPPGWDEVLPPAPGLERLEMMTTSAHEPECPDAWCGLNDTIVWDVRGEFGRVVSGDGVTTDLDFKGKDVHTPRHWEL